MQKDPSEKENVIKGFKAIVIICMAGFPRDEINIIDKGVYCHFHNLIKHNYVDLTNAFAKKAYLFTSIGIHCHTSVPGSIKPQFSETTYNFLKLHTILYPMVYNV